MPLPSWEELGGAPPAGAPTDPANVTASPDDVAALPTGGGLPTYEAMGGAPSQPLSGPAQDSLFRNVGSTVGRIAGAIGDGWKTVERGAGPYGLSDQDTATLRKWGVLPDYQKGQASLSQAFEEAWFRPAVAALASIQEVPQLPAQVAGAVQAGSQQIAEEIQGAPGVPLNEYGLPTSIRGALALPFGALGQAAPASLQMPELAEFGGAMGTASVAARNAQRAETINQIMAARSVGAVGEDEASFMGAHEITPENAEARVEAAHAAGVEPTPPTPPAPDLDALARRVDPAAFEIYDAAALEKQALRQTIADMGSQRIRSPEAREAFTELNEIIAGPYRTETARQSAIAAVRATAPDSVLERLDAAEARVRAALDDDTPEMAEARAKLMAADEKMREQAVAVSTAYRQAREMAPALPAAEAAPVPVPPEVLPSVPVTEGVAAAAQERAAAAAGASEEGKAEVAPAKVTGAETLGEPAPRVPGLQSIAGTGETVERGLARSTEAAAIENDLTLGFGDLPEYRRMNIADQVGKAQRLLDSDPELASAVAMGTKLPPGDLRPESVYVATVHRAVAEGDVDTMMKLANESKLVSQGTAMGQRIRILGELRGENPVAAIQAVQEARSDALAKQIAGDTVMGRQVTRKPASAAAMDRLAQAKEDVVADIKAEVKRSAVTVKPEAWDSFIQSIKCGE